MLTRSGVAKRLGKSIATVRRLENVTLHPVRDGRGVLQFSEEEVERLAGGQPQAGWPLPGLNAASARDFEAELRERDAEIDELRERTKALERTRADERSRFAERLDGLESQLRRVHCANEDRGVVGSPRRSDQPVPDRASPSETTERERVRGQAVELLASLSPREMRRMSPDDLEAIVDLAEGD